MGHPPPHPLSPGHRAGIVRLRWAGRQVPAVPLFHCRRRRQDRQAPARQGSRRYGPQDHHVNFVEFTDIPLVDVSRSRIEFVAGDALHDSVLWYGGHFQFLDLCPDSGCLAVEYTATGEVAHAWPLRPHELKAAAVDYDAEFPYELALNHSLVRDVYPFGVSRYPNGDLLVVFHNERHCPPLLAAAWRGSTATAILSGSEETTATIGRSYAERRHGPRAGDPGRRRVHHLRTAPMVKMTTIRCDTGEPYLDTVNVVDGDGRLLKRIDLGGCLGELQVRIRVTPHLESLVTRFISTTFTLLETTQQAHRE